MLHQDHEQYSSPVMEEEKTEYQSSHGGVGIEQISFQRTMLSIKKKKFKKCSDFPKINASSDFLNFSVENIYNCTGDKKNKQKQKQIKKPSSSVENLINAY